MIVIREIIAVVLFVASAILMVGAVAGNFETVEFLIACLGLVFSYYLWPSRRRGYRRGDHWIFDFLEIVIELPINLVLWLLRLIATAFKGLDFD